VIFEPENYYRLRSRTFIFDGADVDEVKQLVLHRDAVVLCTEIAFRSGEKGRGRYARLLYQRDDETFVLFHRVSKFNRGAGEWEELNPMLALAMAGEIPTL
jgi:hypothetical protein